MPKQGGDAKNNTQNNYQFKDFKFDNFKSPV